MEYAFFLVNYFVLPMKIEILSARIKFWVYVLVLTTVYQWENSEYFKPVGGKIFRRYPNGG